MIYKLISIALSLLLFALPLPASALSSSVPPKAASIGEAIQLATTPEQLLDAASHLWLPSDDNLPSHLRTQQIHHEKRQRWGAQLLEKLGQAGINGKKHIAVDSRFRRALQAVAIPFGDGDEDRIEKEGRYVKQALCSFYAIIGKTSGSSKMPEDLVEILDMLIDRAECMASRAALPDAVEMRWAARGLLKRVQNDWNEIQLDQKIPGLSQRVVGLPFDIVPLGIAWEEILPGEEAITNLRSAIPFNFDTIVTRRGKAVVERRGTAWLAEEDIGALAYSGKLMVPQPIPDAVRKSMRAVEATLGTDLVGSRPYFDCALCNHYPDTEAACKFHTDPEHGTHWERLTCVVAAGDDRRFAFRPISPQKWVDWEDKDSGSIMTSQLSLHNDNNNPAAIHLFPGDIVKMWATCNDDFHHAVYNAPCDVSEEGRVSLVLKRAIDRGGGRKGHGLEGKGRKSRRRNSKNLTQQPRKSKRSRRR